MPWEHLHGSIALLCALALSWVALHPAIDEGVISKVGLLVMIFALLATAALSFTDPDNGVMLWRASFTTNIGLLIACAGTLIRAQREAVSRRPSLGSQP